MMRFGPRSVTVGFCPVCLVLAAVLVISGCGGGSTSGSTTPPPPMAPPTVISVTPTNGLTGVATNAVITATFSKAMNATTITGSNFTVKAPGGTPVTGTLTYSGSTATFTPSTNLAYATQYTATITTGASDTTGAALAANYVWSFTTAQAPVAPTVTVTTPANAATSVSATPTISATFSQAMNAATINSSTFTLTTQGGSTVAGTVAYDSTGLSATFTPAGALGYSTAYTATITTGASNSAGIALTANFVWTFTTGPAPANMATVDFAASKQTIRGFGGSTAWMGQIPTAEVNALFGNGNNQIGLSILRVRIDFRGSAASNWVTTNWTQERANAQAAIAAAPDALVFASPWTPPPSFKASSGSQLYSATCDAGTGACGGYLNPTHYADYANYLQSFVNYMAQGSVNLYAISMQNEPDWVTTYESCSWTADQMHTWVANNASVLTTKLIMPESLNFNPNYAEPTLNDASAVDNVDIIGGHLYGSTPSYYANAVNKGKELWMTEHYLNPSGAQASITDALAAAQEIHNSLVNASYNAYVWWWAANWNPGGGVTKDGLVDTSNVPTYYGYALGQYSKFVRPGYLRISATANPTPGVYVSAYKGGGHYVIVAINTSASVVSQSFTVQNGSVTLLTPYQTSATAKMAPQSAVSVLGGLFTYSLPAQSITTFVQ